MANIFVKSFNFGGEDNYFPLPIVNAEQNGMVLKVVDGEWSAWVLSGEMSISAGLYAADGTFTSWDDLVDSRIIYIDGTNMLYACERTIAGKLVISDDIAGFTGYAFENCTGLTSVIVSNCITIIEEGTFQGCTGLTSIYIPDSVVEMYTPFYDCTALTDVYYAGTEEQWSRFYFGEDEPIMTATIHYNYTGNGSELIY